MKCDHCDKIAVVHEVTVRSGVKSEVHLCEEHAAAVGIALPGEQAISQQLLTQFVICKGGRPRSSATRRVCKTCGLSFAAFRKTGVLGCPDCYAAFEDHLAPMIERAQNGGSSHSGKCPRRGGLALDRRLRIQRLSKELELAVAAEEYEKAAEIRDRLRDLDPDAPAPSPGPSGSDAHA